jgi:hypothetical protein
MLLLIPLSSTQAEQPEQRTFSIQVDGRSAGECRMTIARRDDGAEVVTARVDVRVRFIISYRFTYQGIEIWKNGTLQSLQSTCDDNGKHFQVTALSEGTGLVVRVNGKQRTLPADVWTTSFWKLADARFHNQPVTLLDADRGESLQRQLRYVGTEEVAVAGQTQKLLHFRVTGGPSPVDLWFDNQQRLVRQDFVEQGHRTVVQLASLRR